MSRLKFILLIALLGGSFVATGRVFQAIGVQSGRLNTVGLPWEFAYKTTMEVNGRRNDLRVYSARFSEPVMEQLRDQFERQGAKVSFHETSEGAQGMAKWENHEARILVLSPSSQPNQMIFIFYPEAGKSAAPARLPIPEYPGGFSRKTVLNEGTGSICVTLKTEDAPEQVQSFYAGALAAHGWASIIPPSNGASRMAIYQKRERICTVLATRRSDGLNRVTVLVKGGGL